jgi:hypothetical protein
MLVILARLYREEGKNLGRVFMPEGIVNQVAAAALVILYAVAVFAAGDGGVKPPMP